jgi:cytochrome c oxidase subunit II
MRRPITLIAALASLTFLLAACGDTDNRDSPDASMPMDGGDMGSSMGDGMGHRGNTPVADGARSIEVDATSFEFDPAEITITAGEDIAIVLTSADLEHDFTIDELDTHVAAGKGETAEGGLTADEPGRYTYYCTVEGHQEAGMEGTLIVAPS